MRRTVTLFTVASPTLYHRRRNRGGNEGARPRNAETVKPRRWKCLFSRLFAPAIICQVYLLVDCQTSINLYSFKIFNLNMIMYFSNGCIFKGICAAWKCIKLHAYTHSFPQQDYSSLELTWRTPKCTKAFGSRGFVPNLTGDWGTNSAP